MTTSYVRFFTSEERARQFLAGEVFMPSLRTYRDTAETEDDVGDSCEGTFAYAPTGSVVVIGHAVAGQSLLSGPPLELVAPAKGWCEATLDDRTLCLARVNWVEGRLLVHPKWARYRFAVAVHPSNFLRRLRLACERAEFPSYKWRSIQYWDAGAAMTTEEPGFWKRKRFDWQSEFRVLIEAPSVTPRQKFILRVGDLSDIGLLLRQTATDANETLVQSPERLP